MPAWLATEATSGAPDQRHKWCKACMQPGDKLPSVREMAKQEQLNPNTVAKAYKQLEADGVIFVEPGRGSFIAEPLKHANAAAVATFRPKFDALVVEAQSLGISHSHAAGLAQ